MNNFTSWVTCVVPLPPEKLSDGKRHSDSRSRMTLPPLDLDFEQLNQARLDRLAKKMGLENALNQWKAGKKAYDFAPGTRFNAPR